MPRKSGEDARDPWQADTHPPPAATGGWMLDAGFRIDRAPSRRLRRPVSPAFVALQQLPPVPSPRLLV